MFAELNRLQQCSLQCFSEQVAYCHRVTLAVDACNLQLEFIILFIPICCVFGRLAFPDSPPDSLQRPKVAFAEPFEPFRLTRFADHGYTGTKLGCGEGGCGACTVMLSNWEDGQIVHRAVNACLCPLYMVEGMQVVTVEGIAQYYVEDQNAFSRAGCNSRRTCVGSPGM